MGIVASLASAPVAVEIFKDELRHEEAKRNALKYGHFQVGDTDLMRIKRLTADHNENLEHAHGKDGPGSHPNRGVEKIYLTGVYKKKFEYLSQKMDKHGSSGLGSPYGGKNGPNKSRKVQSAYPQVRLH